MSTKLQRLLTTDKLKSFLPLTLYVIWDIEKGVWFRPRNSKYHKLLFGVWASEEEALQDNTLQNYKVLAIDFSQKIPQDIIRIMDFDSSFPQQEKRNLIISKFKQLIQVFIFQSKNLQDLLNN